MSRMLKKDKITQKDLYNRYVVLKQTQKQIAEEFNISVAYVSKLLKKFELRIPFQTRHIGKTFGDLTIIKYCGKDKYNHSIYECVCSCSKDITKTIKLPITSLLSGNTKSCGCKSRKRGKDHLLFKGYEDIPNIVMLRIKRNADARNIKILVTIKQIWDLYIKQDKKCALSGLPIFFSPTSRKLSLQTASLDRIDSSKPYEEGNIQWIHKKYQAMKMDMNQEEFIEYCKYVAYHSYNT